MACVFNPISPYTTWTPASSSLRAQRTFANSSKRALISITARTCLPAAAASRSASIIGESPEVLYRVCLIARTFGSVAAVSRKRTTVEEKEW